MESLKRGVAPMKLEKGMEWAFRRQFEEGLLLSAIKCLLWLGMGIE